MAVCTKCNRVLEEGARFCDNCGFAITDAAYCANCGLPVEKGLSFCPNCGINIGDGAPKPKAALKNLRKKLLVIVSILLAIVCVFNAVTFISRKISSNNKYIAYIKDGEAHYMNTKKAKTHILTDCAFSNKKNTDNILQYIYAGCTTITNNNKMVFYPEEVHNYENGGFTLNCRYLNKPKKEPVKVASNVSGYRVSSKGDIVYYLSHGMLWQTDLKEHFHIDNDVKTFFVSSDGSKIIYTNHNGDLYYKKKNGTKERLDSNATIGYAFTNLRTFYYLKDGTLYKKSEKSDRQKVDSGVTFVIPVSDTGKFYYTKQNDIILKLSDFVYDNLMASDLRMERPAEPSYPYSWNFSDYDSYKAAYKLYETKYYEYEEAYAEYRNKIKRDNIRKELEEETYTIEGSSLYYYDGKSSTFITDSISGFVNTVIYKSGIIYKIINNKNIGTVKISEISSINGIYNYIEYNIYENAELRVCIEKTESVLGNYYSASINESNTGISYKDKENNLYSAKISGNSLGKAELIDSDVTLFEYLHNDLLLYFKKNDIQKDYGYTGNLYVDKKIIDYNVYTHNISYSKDGSFTYLIDWDNTGKGSGTLKKYNGNEVKHIADNVRLSYTPDASTTIYITTNNSKGKSQELYLYKGDKSEYVDDKVDFVYMLSPRYKDYFSSLPANFYY